MTRYFAAAIALKCFSSSRFSRAIYRKVGNRVGDKRRRAGTMPAYYPERVRRTLRLALEHKIVRDGDRVFELGTGWLHWEAITLRLFYDIEAVLYDVWDNRQLGGLKNYFRQLSDLLEDGFDLSANELKRARGIIESILKVESFSGLYDLLGFEYVVDGSGSLSGIPGESIDVFVSAGVLEHVHRDALPGLMAESHRVLKPGGWAIHSIDTSDHLSHYDASVSKKKYLAYSERKWRILFENEVQYINRVQRGEWLDLFKASGLELIEEDSRPVDISDIAVADRFRKMDRQDLETTVMRAALRKPAAPRASSTRVDSE